MRKTKIVCLLLVIVLLTSLSVIAKAATDEIEAQGQCGEGVFWSITESGVLTISGQGRMNDYPASASAEYLPPWLLYRDTLRTVIIEDGVTYLGNYAFFKCTALKNVQISNTVTAIGDEVFSKCTSLTHITVPASVTELGSGLVRECTSLKTAELLCQIDEIPVGMFHKTALTSFVIPDGVTKIASSAFDGCQKLTSVTIPESVTVIGENAFNYTPKLTKVTLPSGLTYIGRFAFSGCAALADVIFTGDAPQISGEAFADTVTRVYYPVDNVTWTQDVMRDYGGTLMWIPVMSGETVDPDPYSGGCGAGTKWKYSNGKLTISGTGEVEYVMWRGLADQVKTVVIEKGVTNIPNDAFSEFTKLTSVTIPNTVQVIGADAFYGCTALKKLTIPNGVTTIEPLAFTGCTALASISIPDSVTEIGFRAFEECDSLTKVTLPKNLSAIEDNLFAFCDKLTTVNIPYGAAYVGHGAFMACAKLSSITIPGTVSYLDDYAFNGCTSLRTVRFEGNAPKFKGNFPFQDVTATCYYPKGNPTWTRDAMSTFNAQLTWVGYTPSSQVGPLGDASGDGIVDSYDATLLLQFDVGMIRRADMSAAALDVSGDGIIDSYDATLILQYDVGMITEFPGA